MPGKHSICVEHILGEDGYHWLLRQQDADHNPTNKKVSSMDFYAYHLMNRLANSDHIFRAQDLLQQFMVDMYAKIEAERLAYIASHQKELRVDDYAHLRDAVNNDAEHGHELGRMVILPSSFTGGPRYMHEKSLDALTYVRHYGRPDLFITFTCNPKWPDIKSNLFENQEPKNRHDVIARVFRLKVKKLMHLLTKSHIFGATMCDMYTIEWQQRGLPHAHILLWLKEKIHSNQIDSFISAEIPNQEHDPELHDIVKSQMIHGPCGYINPQSPCMKEGKCTKIFPKQLLHETQTGHDGYPLYRRRKPEDGGHTTTIKVRGVTEEMVIDNKWIVPYCPLSTKAPIWLFIQHTTYKP